MIRSLPLYGLLLLALAHPAPLALGAPTVQVRAHTRITIDNVTATAGQGARIIGRLMEVGSSTGVAGAMVFVKVAGEEQAVQTRASGRFEADFNLSQGDYRISAAFPGDTEYGPSEVTDFPFNLGKQLVTITITAPREIDTSAASVELQITARSDDVPQRLAVDLSIADLGASLRVVQRAVTDEEGRATVTMPRALLGAPGEKRVHAEFKGDANLNPASDETTFRVVTATAFKDVELPQGTIKHEARLTATGRLVDAGDAPVPGVTVSLLANSKRIGGAVTNAEGRFKVSGRASSIAPGAADLAVEYVSTSPWRRGARTTPVQVTILPPRPVPLGYTIGAFCATAAVLLGFVLVRTRPWDPLVAYWRARRKKPEGEGAVAPRAGGVAVGGLQLARPTLMSSIRRPADLGISGSVRDVVTGVGVTAARVVLTLPPAGVSGAETDGEGHFEVSGLTPGTWRGEAAAHGYVTERFTATVPHRGELRGVRIDLVPVRERLFSIYREIAEPLLPKSGLWGIWTPREIIDHVRRTRPAGQLAALTDFIEDAYFSGRVPDESILPVAAQRAKAARDEASPAAASPGTV